MCQDPHVARTDVFVGARGTFVATSSLCQNAKQHPGGGSADVEATNDVSFALLAEAVVMVLLLLVVVVGGASARCGAGAASRRNLRFESPPPASTWRHVQAAPFQHLPSLK